MTSYDYIVSVAGSTIAVDLVDQDSIYTIDREGIGIRRETGGGESVTGDVYSFTRQGVRTGGLEVNEYMIMISLTYGFVSQVGIIEIGSVVNEDRFYTLTIDSDSVYYKSEPSDTVTDIRDGLISAINGHSWADTVTASIDSANRLEVLCDNLSASISCEISTFIFKSGYYVTFALNGGPVKTYIIEINSSAAASPALPTLDSSYLYSDLVLAPAGVQAVTDTPGSYLWDDFDPISAGTVTITDSPQFSLPPAGRCLYNDGTIYFGAPALTVGERIKMITI